MDTTNPTTLTRTTILDAPAEAIWRAVLRPRSFTTVTRGMLRMPVLKGRTRDWQPGERIVGRIWLFGFVPLHCHHLEVAQIDHDARLLRSDEHGGLIRVWRHDIVVEPLDDRRCRYTDRLDIEAGWATRPVALFAAVFYRIRQRRWRQLAQEFADDPAAV